MTKSPKTRPAKAGKRAQPVGNVTETLPNQVVQAQENPKPKNNDVRIEQVEQPAVQTKQMVATTESKKVEEVNVEEPVQANFAMQTSADVIEAKLTIDPEAASAQVKANIDVISNAIARQQKELLDWTNQLFNQTVDLQKCQWDAVTTQHELIMSRFSETASEFDFNDVFKKQMDWVNKTVHQWTQQG